ncbi:TcpQ domain-containing protein [Pseudomonas aeruginosa]
MAPAPLLAPQAAAPRGLFGRDVPLKAALENLVENRFAWTIVIEPGLESQKVSWSNASSWRDAVEQIGRTGGLIVKISEDSKRIVATRSESMASQLSASGSSVWSLKQGVGLRENLVAWGKLAHWEVQFVGTEINYPVDHSATLVGQFEGKGGVVDRLMMATQSREVPLKATFYKGNRVVVIREAGYKPNEATIPSVDEE